MATTTKELSVQLEEVTKRLRALESGQNVMTSSPGLPLEKWNDHGFVHRHEIKPLVRALNNGGGSTAELEERVEGLESGYTGLSSSMRSAASAITDIYGAIRANTTYESFGDIPSTSLGVFTVGGGTASPIPDAPYPYFRGLWTVEQRGVPRYLYQEATQVLSGFNGYGETWKRVQNDGVWSIWYCNVESLASANKYFDSYGSNDLFTSASGTSFFITPRTVNTNNRRLSGMLRTHGYHSFKLNAPAGRYLLFKFKAGVFFDLDAAFPVIFTATDPVTGGKLPPVVKWATPGTVSTSPDPEVRGLYVDWTDDDTTAVASYTDSRRVYLDFSMGVSIDLTLF